MIYDTPPKPFYVFESGSDDFAGFNTLGEAMDEAKSRCAEKELTTPVYVFETKASFNTD